MADTIRELLLAVVGLNKVPFQTVEGTVKSVDWDNRVCTIAINDGYELENVRLRAVADNTKTGFVCKPKIDSQVLVSIVYNKPMNAYISMFSDIDNVVLLDDKGNARMEIDVPGGNVLFNGGANKGLIKVVELLQRLNTVEEDLNTIKKVFSGWTPVPNDGGAALKGAASTWASQSINITTQSEIENTKVKH